MKVLVTTGGSGGHIFPAMQVGQALKARGHEVIFAGSLSMAEARIKAAGFEVKNIPAQGLVSKTPWGMMRFAYTMMKAYLSSCSLLSKILPDKVIGFGGYGSFAMIAAASVAHYPTMIHEQNVLPGKANRLMGRLVSKIALSFKGSEIYFPKGRSTWTGCPCHQGSFKESREELLKVFGLDQMRKVILVLGGSQGSSRLNEVFFTAMSTSKDLPMQAIHMTGQADAEKYRAQYEAHQLPVKPFAFINNIEQAYSVADVVVARSGASTVCELGLRGKPSILVPYPFAGGHQRYNAEVLTKAKVAILIEQKDLDENSLKKALHDILFNNSLGYDLNAKTKDLFNADAALFIALMVETL